MKNPNLNDPPKLVEVLKVTTGDFNHPASFHEHDLPKGALQILIREKFLCTMSFMSLRYDRIYSLKVKIFHQTHIAPSMQNLFFAGVELDNHRTFSDHNIPCRSIIDLVVKRIGKITINVSIPYHSISLFLDTRTTIHKVKALFRDKTDISTDNLRLVYAGRELQDSRTLAYYYVQNASILLLVNDRWKRGIFQSVYVMIASTGKIFHLRVDCLCTINHLKAMIQDHESIPAHLQTLFLPQKQLQDGSTLVDNYIHQGTFIHVVQ
ncbi:senescence-specific cysteine protease SAG39-like protein, partial [Tanacetum coccineum]